MDNKIEVFKNEQFGEVRTVLIGVEPWFVAVDVCNALDIGNPSQAISKLDVKCTPSQGHFNSEG